MDDAAPVDTACVAAFVGGECRGVARALSSGLYFITIAGNSEENGEAVSFRTWVDGEELPIKETIPFAVDVISGELSSPTLLHINTTGIDDILIDNNVVSVQYHDCPLTHRRMAISTVKTPP